MPYGLELEDVHYEVDANGNKVRAIVPLTMFTALTEFWIAARRAQTAKIEATTKPGKFKTSLSAVRSGQADESDPPAPPPPTFRHDQHWQNLIERMPEATDIAPAASNTSFAAPEVAKAIAKNKQTFYPREFVAPIPEEVAALINRGVYFLKAWREYRALDLRDMAELFGKSRAAVQYFDYGYLKPCRTSLEQFAVAFDCTLDQLTVKPGSNTQAWLTVITSPPPAQTFAREEFAPEDTDYPDAVLHSMIEGKAPITAWRLYRGHSRGALAKLYGERVTEAAIKEMESAAHLSTKTMARLAAILKCTPVQLLKPEGLVIERAAKETPASRRITDAMMMQAGR